MLKHKLISQVKIKNNSGETFKIALVETDVDYIIAYYYRGKKDSWGNGVYMPKSAYTPSVVLTDFANVIASYEKSIFTKTINF